MRGDVGFGMQGSSLPHDVRPVGRRDDAGPVRVTLLTPPGRGALAVAGVNGVGAEAVVMRLFVPRGQRPLSDRTDGAIVYGRWLGTESAGEDVIVVRRGRDDLEVHCHGGHAAVEAVLGRLVQHGAVRQSWPEWLAAAGRSEIEVEARAALCRAGGPKAAGILSRQLAGGLEEAIARIDRMLARRRGPEAATEVERLLRASRIGLRLVRPWRVVFAGLVNAGKSSLVNAVAGHARCIVAPEAGTTRDLVETRLVLGGWEVDLVDAAGLREAALGGSVDRVEAAGIARAQAAAATADLVVRVVDPWSSADDAMPPPGVHAETKRRLLVFTKGDLGQTGRPVVSGESIWTSATTGEGIELLVARIVRTLVPEEEDEPELLYGAVPFTERQVAMLRDRCRP